MDLAGFCDKNIIVSDEALHCELVRGVKPLFEVESKNKERIKFVHIK